MKYYLTIGGVKYEHLRLKFKRVATIDSESADILILPAPGSVRPTINDSVLITKELDNTILTKWQGTVQQIQDVPLPNNVIKIIAYDLKFKSNFLNVLNAGYASSKGSTIFSTEVEPSKTGLTLGTVDTTDTVLDTMSFGKSITGKDSKVTKSSLFEIIQVVGDRDVYVQRDGTVSYEDAGTDRSSTHVLEHGLNGVLMPDIGYSEDETRRVKQVIVKGAGTGSNFILGTAGVPLSTDKVKQIELPYIPSNATATLAATTIYNELNKTNKYAKFMLTPDLFKTNYDVFDTVKLKARLSNKTVDENLKIFSIETTVSSQDESHEIVIIELQNFERAQLAKMVNPIEASSNSLANMRTGIEMTQAENHVLPTSLGQYASLFIEATVTSTPTNIGTIGTFSSQKTNGAYVHFGLKCTIRSDGGIPSNYKVIRFYVNLGAVKYPVDENIDHLVGKIVGEQIDVQITYFIAAEVADSTVTLVAESNGKIDVEGSAYMYSLGL